ncbi:MAG: hypothetical protein Q9209_003791 [Squamulea sp. 1 TL-2023]
MAKSEYGNTMYPISWREFKDPVTGETETRKTRFYQVTSQGKPATKQNRQWLSTNAVEPKPPRALHPRMIQQQPPQYTSSDRPMSDMFVIGGRSNPSLLKIDN